jgi:hypothetical protein
MNHPKTGKTLDTSQKKDKPRQRQVEHWTQVRRKTNLAKEPDMKPNAHKG